MHELSNSHAISLKGIVKSFGSLTAVDNLSLQVEAGEYLALLGPNGAGKTTLVEMIEGIQKPDAGDIHILGKTWAQHQSELRHRLGICLQETNFVEKSTVGETLNLFASFFGLQQKKVDEVLDAVNLREKKNAGVQKLSGGQKQRLAIGIAILNDPELLLLDEPTTGLDPTARREVWEILLSLKKKQNTTLILTTHYMEEADFLCDRIVLMNKGKILMDGDLEGLLETHNTGEIIEFSLAENNETLRLPNTQPLWDAKKRKWRLQVTDIVETLPGFLESIKSSGHTLSSLECHKMTLDDLFLSKTGRTLIE